MRSSFTTGERRRGGAGESRDGRCFRSARQPSDRSKVASVDPSRRACFSAQTGIRARTTMGAPHPMSSSVLVPGYDVHGGGSFRSRFPPPVSNSAAELSAVNHVHSMGRDRDPTVWSSDPWPVPTRQLRIDSSWMREVPSPRFPLSRTARGLPMDLEGARIHTGEG